MSDDPKKIEKDKKLLDAVKDKLASQVSQTQIKTSSKKLGLSEKEAAERLKKYGLNQITKKKEESLLVLFLNQFTDIFSLLLIGAAFTSLLLYFLHYTTSFTDALLIFLILFVNGLVSTFQQWKAEKSLEKLKQLQQSFVIVLRDGKRKRIPSTQVTVGDVVVLEEGVKIPADGKVVVGGVMIDESSFTGESFPVEKGQGDKVYAGTFVVGGNALFEVESVGSATRLGKLGTKLSSMEETSFFKGQLNNFSYKLLKATLVVMLIFFIASYHDTHDLFAVLLASIALVVAVVPEGLPMVAAITMMYGVQRLAKHNVLVKKLDSIEALGAVEYVVFDKTGTLTEGTLIVAHVDDQLKHHLRYYIVPNSQDPVEKALETFCNEEGIEQPKELQAGFVPFDYRTKSSSVEWIRGKTKMHCIKGAPETIMAITGTDFSDHVAKYAHRGYRVLAFARKKNRYWVYEGLVAFKDPLKPSAKKALEEMVDAHMVPIMITGDHKDTAYQIATEVGISGVMLSGEMLRKYTYKAVSLLKNGGVVYRAEPEDKLVLVEELRKMGKVVAATGDGVNDVLLLKRADVGIAMGKRGTDIAKEAADIVLLKDDLQTIVEGIVEGRTIITNVRKFVTFLLSSNIAEVVCAFFVPILSVLLVLDAPKLLWINLITDGMPATTFAFDEDMEYVQQQPPSYFRELTLPFMEKMMFFRGIGSGLLVCLFFWLALQLFPAKEAAGLLFSALTLGEVFGMYTTRYLFRSKLFGNMWMNLSVLFVVILHLVAVQYFAKFFSIDPLGFYSGIALLIFLIVDTGYGFVLAHVLGAQQGLKQPTSTVLKN